MKSRFKNEYEDYRIALARRADKDNETLTLAQARKALGLFGHRKDIYR